MTLDNLKYSSLVFLLVLLTSSCKFTDTTTQVNKGQIDQVEYRRDSVLERNNPKSLDLSTHQLYIDTTRQSTYYQDLLHWKPAFLDEYKNSLAGAEGEIWKKIPKKWVRLRKYKGEFYLYHCCDCPSVNLYFHNGHFTWVNSYEFQSFRITQIDGSVENGFQVDLEWTETHAENSAPYTLRLIPSGFPSIYELDFKREVSMDGTYYIQADRVIDYDLIVNHCPIKKETDLLDFEH